MKLIFYRGLAYQHTDSAFLSYEQAVYGLQQLWRLAAGAAGGCLRARRDGSLPRQGSLGR
jgi:hypothetical protein